MATRPDSRNYYEVLHVSRNAPTEIIRTSYRTLMQRLKNHPDLGGDPAVAALINEAYAVLTDAERRAEYDARLDVLEQLARGVNVDTWVEETTAGIDAFRDPYRECVFCETPHQHGKFIEVDASCSNCASPLYTADNRRIELTDQRAVARLRKRQSIAFYTQWPQRKAFDAYTEDISPNGLKFVTRRDLIRGQTIKIVSDVVESIATVTHCQHERRGWTTKCVAGVSFVTLRFVRAIGGFVSDQV